MCDVYEDRVMLPLAMKSKNWFWDVFGISRYLVRASNQDAVELFQNLVSSSNSKHINVRHHILRPCPPGRYSCDTSHFIQSVPLSVFITHLEAHLCIISFTLTYHGPVKPAVEIHSLNFMLACLLIRIANGVYACSVGRLCMASRSAVVQDERQRHLADKIKLSSCGLCWMQQARIHAAGLSITIIQQILDKSTIIQQF